MCKCGCNTCDTYQFKMIENNNNNIMENFDLKKYLTEGKIHKNLENGNDLLAQSNIIK